MKNLLDSKAEKNVSKLAPLGKRSFWGLFRSPLGLLVPALSLPPPAFSFWKLKEKVGA